MIHVIVYKEPIFNIVSDNPKRPKEIVDPDSYIPKYSSLKRTKQLIKDIIICNNFDYFCTFTFNPDKVDSFSFAKCYSKISTWLHHQADRSREQHVKFDYLIVPEQHKSGRWHFHALIKGYTGSLSDSKRLTSTGRRVYNITSFRSGFTTAVAIDCKEAVGEYVSKYITKDFIRMFNQRRFFCSRGLIRPKITRNSRTLNDILPLFKRERHDTLHYSTWSAMKSDLL